MFQSSVPKQQVHWKLSYCAQHAAVVVVVVNATSRNKTSKSIQDYYNDFHFAQSANYKM